MKEKKDRRGAYKGPCFRVIISVIIRESLNNRSFSEFKKVILWSEFRVAWVLFAGIIAAFALDATVFAPNLLLFVEGGLLAIVFVLVGITTYRAAQTDRDTKIERNELKREAQR